LKTVKQLAAELNISKSTLHRLIHDNNIETIQQGNKRLIDETIETAIIQALKEKTLQSETIQNDSETVQKRFKNDSRNDIETIQSEYIESLKAQVQLLTEQLKMKDKQIADLSEQVKDFSLKLDKQQALHAGTIQTQLIDKQAPAEPTTAAATKRPAQRPRPERQQPRKKQSMLDSFLKAFRRKQA
jgi:excisionase family DNA binding protein